MIVLIGSSAKIKAYVIHGSSPNTSAVMYPIGNATTHSVNTSMMAAKMVSPPERHTPTIIHILKLLKG